MKRIAIISDTHGFWDEKYVTYMADCDEIWHAGDIGSLSLANAFEDLRPRFRAVYGNIDDVDVRARYPEILRFKCEKGDVLMILEAMKMENEIMAPCDGTVASVNVNAGASVETGTLLCVIG